MAESFISDRIIFSRKGAQAAFLSAARESLAVPWSALAKELSIHTRTMNAWKREESRMTFRAAKYLARRANMQIPKSYSIHSWKQHLKKISRKGGEAVMAKYGRVAHDEMRRKTKWMLWWKKVGAHARVPDGFITAKEIICPRKSEALAEFVGIMLGDGGVSPYQITVTLSSREKEYRLFVLQLITRLFGLVPSTYAYRHAAAVRVVVSGIRLVTFCQRIGLVVGNKVRHQVDIPSWIINDVSFAKACVRGLVDTDGCFYNNSYVVGGRRYQYLKIAFTSASLPLVGSVAHVLSDSGIKVSLCRKGREIRIVCQESVARYIRLFGSHNGKHLEKISRYDCD